MGENVSLLANDVGYLTAVTSADITDDQIVDADVISVANIAATKLQGTVMVETENVSLLTYDVGYLSAVTSADITDDQIVDADVNSIANIAATKLQATVMVETENVSLLTNVLNLLLGMISKLSQIIGIGMDLP